MKIPRSVILKVARETGQPVELVEKVAEQIPPEVVRHFTEAKGITRLILRSLVCLRCAVAVRPIPKVRACLLCGLVSQLPPPRVLQY